MSLLVVQDLGIAFGGLVAVDGVSFNVERGEIFALIGPNGAGKTTLFNIISGIYTPKRGRIMLDGEDVSGLAPHQLAGRGHGTGHIPPGPRIRASRYGLGR